MILPADKGRVTVVLEKNQYEEKMITMLNDTTTYIYKSLQKDPTMTLERRMNAFFHYCWRISCLKIYATRYEAQWDMCH